MKVSTILVPTDFSARADAALECASELAKGQGATLAILHVEMAPLIRAPYDDEDDPVDHQAHRQLDGVRPSDRSVSFEKCLLKGAVAEEILRYAKQREAELIVMGTHGETNSPARPMGAVAEAVTRRAECMVVTVKPAVEAAHEAAR